jgi:predicted Zn-dependent peptidase
MKTMLSTKAILLAGLLVISLMATVVAQTGGTSQGEPQSIKGAVLKGRAPVNRTVLKVKLPKAQEATLMNGLRLVVLERSKVPTFSMEMVVLSGGLADAPDKRGLAGVTAALLREGTVKHNSREIAEQLDILGATLNANSGLNSFTTNINAAGLVENFDQVLDLFAEVIRTPRFPADELGKYKSRTISGLQLIRSQPGFLAQERLAQAIYGTHPAATVSQPLDPLKKFTSEDLAQYHAANYLPNNAILFVVGDVN